MADKQYNLKSYDLLFKSEGNYFQYKLASSEESFKGSLLESLLSDKKRFTEGGENFAPQNAFKVRVVLHSHKDFAIGQVSQAEDVATFAQKFFLPGENEDDKKKEYLPVVHITLDDSYVYNLYNLCGSIYVGGIFYEKKGLFAGGEFVGEEKLTKLREKLPSRISRSYQILDSSIWNKIVPYKSFARRIANNIGKHDEQHDEHIAGGSKGLFDAISEIAANYKRGLYSLGVAKEYANLNARLTLQSFLSGSHASGVSPFIFHSESSTNKMINDEFNNKNVDNKPIIDKIKERKWRILLIDDKARSQMDSDGGNTPKAEDGLYNNCKLRIIKNLFEDQFGKAKIEWRSCKHGLKDPALYIWYKDESHNDNKEKLLQLFGKEINGERCYFNNECLYEIVSQTSQANCTTSQDEDKKSKMSNQAFGLSKYLKQITNSLARKTKDDSLQENEETETCTQQKGVIIGYKYVGDSLSRIKSKIDIELNNIFETEIEKEIDHNASFLIEYAETLDEAENALQTKKYDFILLDYLLSNEYGYELLDRIYCYKEAKRIFDEKDWGKLISVMTSPHPSREYDELSHYFTLKEEEIEKLEKLMQTSNNNPDNEIRKAKEDAKIKRNLIKKILNKDELKNNKNLLEELLDLDEYKFGPHGRFFFMFISAYTSAVYERLLAEGLNRNEKYWYIAVGACPTNTPNLFIYNLLKLMEKQLYDSGVDRLSSVNIFNVVDKIYGTKVKGEVRAKANEEYQDILDLQYMYRKMLKDVQIPSDGNIFNTAGSVLITDFITKNVNLGGLLEHLTQLVHITAFGTVRQWPEMWEEYTYFKSQFQAQFFEDNKENMDKFNNLCIAIENYILKLKKDMQ